MARGSFLCFELNLPNSTIDAPFQSLLWKGNTGYITFSVTFANHAIGSQIGKLLVSLNDVPVGVIRFLIVVSAATRYFSALCPFPALSRIDSQQGLFPTLLALARAESLPAGLDSRKR